MIPTLPPSVRREGETLHETTRSICPECRTVIDAHVPLRDDGAFMRKRCRSTAGSNLIYGDAHAPSRPGVRKPTDRPRRGAYGGSTSNPTWSTHR